MPSRFLRGIFFSCLILFTACNSETDPNIILGKDNVENPPGYIPPGAVNPDGGVGSGCNTSDPNSICLAVKFVAFKDSSGTPTVTREQAAGVVDAMNTLWSQCSINFTLENYLPVNSTDYGIRYSIANYSELTQVRNTFEDDHTLLLAVTGTWNRAGSLGGTGANAWTSLPGSGPYGAIMEKPVGTNGNLIAHEVGHYLNLGHVSDSYALMNPIIYGRSTNIYSSQCNTARSASKYFWTAMIR